VDLAVALVGHRYNWNSLSALSGAIEVDARLSGIHLVFVRPEVAASRLAGLAAAHETVIAGFSFTTPDLLRTAAQVAVLRRDLPQERYPNLLLVAGGPHATALPRSALEIGFDYVVVGEGEAVFPDLLCALGSGERTPWLRGVAYRAGDGSLVQQGRARPINLADYPPFSVRFRRQGPIEITRGCPHHCRFCAAPFLAGRRVRHRPLRAVLSGVETCLAHGIDQIRFIAPNAFAYGSATEEPALDVLAELLRISSAQAGRENVFLGSFPSEVRPESVTPAAVELVARYCGNDNLVIGAQSGSPRMLEAMRRGHTVDQVRRAVQITHAAGLRANVDFIFGLPGETAEDKLLSRRFAEELATLGARIHSHAFMPLPGSAWAHESPGEIDDSTARWLGGLAGEGREYGSWKKQAAEAHAIAAFLARQGPLAPPHDMEE